MKSDRMDHYFYVIIHVHVGATLIYSVSIKIVHI